ncbi:MAG: quinone-dependent dihydroorotate dehydrogenase [Candidatus Magasanikbacteria bacterium]|nr:quinone-dependent dihydroorotate dehydrogenase [Candidatus Magasanikbacteria bacterium]
MFAKNKANLIGLVYKKVFKPVFFRLDPEFVHDRFIKVGNLMGKCKVAKFFTRNLFDYKNSALQQNILDINFENPIGLSAGFDKNGKLIDILGGVGFGFMQVGTITNEYYKGNPKPRLHRLIKSKALIVYYGLKNDGVEKIIERLKKSKKTNFVKGISIGKTNCTRTAGLDAGVEDYFECYKKVLESGVGDFYTLNISCPNTFGGEPFTKPEKLLKLLEKIYSIQSKKPIFLKMPINLPWVEFEKLLEIIVQYKINGVIIGNLNKNFQDKSLKDKISENMKGGISGKPTKKLSNELISKTYKKYGDNLVIVGVGGIFSAEDAYEKIKLGASLVQLITGMIFEGPQLIGKINIELVKLMKKDGFEKISQAVGVSHKKT